MINEDSVNALKVKQKTARFQCPLYENYGFSCLSDTVKKLFLGKGAQALSPSAVGGYGKSYECAVLFLIDGFGWEFFQAYAPRYPALQRLLNEGIVSQISAEFPSTTAAHLTSLHTGQEVGQLGIYEWFQYEPIVDGMISPLLFSYAGDYEAGGLAKEGYSVEALFPFETLYQQLARQGIRSVIFQQEKIAKSAYSQALLAGAEVVSFASLGEVLQQLTARLASPCAQPTYFFVYMGEIDGAGHRHGLVSPQFADAVDSCWTQVEEHFWKRLGQCANRTAVMFTADHGMVSINPKETVFLNERVPHLAACMKKNRKGQLLVPAGSCRDFFLHIEERFLTQMHQELQEELKEVADVLEVDALIEEGFFGSKPVSSRFRERVGNLVVLPHRGQNVFWRFEKHHFEQHFYAAHGGLTPEEMQSVFSFVSIE